MKTAEINTRKQLRLELKYQRERLKMVTTPHEKDTCRAKINKLRRMLRVIQEELN